MVDHYTANPEMGPAECAAYNDFRDIIARKNIDAVRIATPDHPVPYSPPLEDDFLPSGKSIADEVIARLGAPAAH